MGYDPTYLTKQVGKGAENYYLSSVGDADRGEPPGIWVGRACAELGFTAGAEVNAAVFERLFGTFADPRAPEFSDPAVAAGEKPILGRRPANYGPESGRKPVYFIDLTFSPPKSVTLLHAGLLARAAVEREQGNQEQAQAFAEQAGQVWAAIWRANATMLEFYQDQVAHTRAGRHSVKIEGRTTGRWIDAPDWVAASFAQHTNRNGDPQLHIHNPVLNKVPCADGKWRTLDSRAIHKVRPAAAAVAERVMWEELTSGLGVRVRAREDGHGWEVDGVEDDLIARFSSRRVQVVGMLGALRAEYVRRHGHEPNARALFSMGQYATKATKAAKNKDWAPTHAQELAGWQESSRQVESGALAEVPDLVRERAANQPDGGVQATGLPDGDPIGQLVAEALRHLSQGQPADMPLETEADDPPEGELLPTALDEAEPAADAIAEPGPSEQDTAQAEKEIHQVLQAAIDQVQQAKAVFSRFEVWRAINAHLPGHIGELDPTQVQTLLQELTEQAIGPGNAFGVHLLNLPEVVDFPAELRRPDGASVYTAPCAQRYTTDDQLTVETTLLHAAQELTAPALTAEQVSSWVDPRRRAVEGGRGLRQDQAAAIAGIATSGRTIDVLEGPAGSGKSYVLAKLAGMWRVKTGTSVIGLTLSTNASYVLAAEGFDRAHNIRKFLMLAEKGRLRLEPGSLIVVDEASMVPTADLAAIHRVAAAAGCKMLWAGDTAQLSAPEAGGLMRVLAVDGGSHELTVVERMRAPWERAASLRLRVGDVQGLNDYEEHERFVEGDREQMAAAVVAAYVADRDAGKHSLLLAPSNTDAAELAAQVRAVLVERGEVAPDGVQLHDGNIAGIGDLIVARANNTRIKIAGTWRTLSNRDQLVVHDISPNGGLYARLVTDAHPDGNPAKLVAIPATYVAKFVELGYAGTVHSAQGRTVDISRALIDGRVTHQMLYVMLTRGREGNFGYVDVGPRTAADLRPGSAPAAQLAGVERAPGAPELTRATVLADILERDDASPAAVEAMRGEGERVTHMAHLTAIWSDILRTEAKRRFSEALAAELGPDRYPAFETDPARAALWAILNRAELAGQDGLELIRTTVRRRGFEDADSIAQVLHYRVEELLIRRGVLPDPEAPAAADTPQQIAAAGLSWQARTPQLDKPELHRLTVQLAEQMDRRTTELGNRLAEAPPAWAQAQLGAVPDEPLFRQEWIIRAGVVAAYGETYGVPFHQDQRPPRLAAERQAAWDAARQALSWVGQGEHFPPTILQGAGITPPPPGPPAAERTAAAAAQPATIPTPAPASDGSPLQREPTADQQALAAVRRSSAILALSQIPYGIGLLPDRELVARASGADGQTRTATDALNQAMQDMREYAANGGGPAEVALAARRDKLAAQCRQIEVAEAAGAELAQARQVVTEAQQKAEQLRLAEANIQQELAGLGGLLPAHRARRRELEAAAAQVREDLAAVIERAKPVRQAGPALAQQAAAAEAQAPRPAVWSLIRRQHQDMIRQWEDIQRGGRDADIAAARNRAERAVREQQEASHELQVAQDEVARRSDLPDRIREIEQAARLEHIERERQAADRRQDRTPGRPAERNRDAYRPPPAHERDDIDRGFNR